MGFNTFLKELSKAPIKVVSPSVDFDSYVPIDLSNNNKDDHDDDEIRDQQNSRW